MENSIVTELKGILKVNSVEEFDEKKILEDELLEKYGIQNKGEASIKFCKGVR
ncbi:MAG: hypothetical protein ACPGVB_09695 [Chitinophagales bacterium]